MTETDQDQQKANPIKKHLYNFGALLLFALAIPFPGLRPIIFYSLGTLIFIMSSFQLWFLIKENERHNMAYFNLFLSGVMLAVIIYGLIRPEYNLYAIYYLIAMQFVQILLTVYQLHLKKAK
jgi:ABC-type Fe3+-siderophore transport system permease subunit